MILFGPLAVYILYVTFTESWTRTDRILMIVLLAGGVFAPPILERIWKSKHDKGHDKNNDLPNS